MTPPVATRPDSMQLSRYALIINPMIPRKNGRVWRNDTENASPLVLDKRFKRSGVTDCLFDLVEPASKRRNLGNPWFKRGTPRSFWRILPTWNSAGGFAGGDLGAISLKCRR